MKLDISEIIRIPSKIKVYDFEEMEFGKLDSEIISDKPVKGSLVFKNVCGIIKVKGTFETELLLTCGRCLENFRQKISSEIEEDFPLGKEVTDLYMDDPEFPLFKDSKIDITELLRQYVLLEVPVQPLCSEDCKGFCQGCGVNLNNSDCVCSENENINPFK